MTLLKDGPTNFALLKNFFILIYMYSLKKSQIEAPSSLAQFISLSIPYFVENLNDNFASGSIL